MKLLLLTITISAVLSSCYAYQIFPKEARKFVSEENKNKAYVLNPELSNEFQILKKSGLYTIVEDSSNDSVRKIKLYPIKKTGGVLCGDPIIGFAFTLGQVPMVFPATYQYQFDDFSKSDTLHKQQELSVATRYWFWNIFVFNKNKNFNKKAGQALQAGYYNN